MENIRRILAKVTSSSSYSRHSVAKWRVPRFNLFELHHYTEKICTEEQTLVPGNDVYTFSQIFKETNDRGIFENRIIFFQNIV